jgi:hypothetical protein
MKVYSLENTCFFIIFSKFKVLAWILDFTVQSPLANEINVSADQFKSQVKQEKLAAYL